MTDGTLAPPVRINYIDDVTRDPETREYRTGTPESNERLDRQPPTYLDDDVYGEALKAFVVACVDIMVVGPDGRVLLGRRQQEPQPDWWIIGGRMRTRDTYLQAAARNVRRELGIIVDAVRFHSAPLGAYSNVWDTRAQAPQNDGCHTISFVMVYCATLEEVEALVPNEEYAQVAWLELRDIAKGDYHPALRQMAHDLIQRLG